jgi:hypothetical protein
MRDDDQISCASTHPSITQSLALLRLSLVLACKKGDGPLDELG